MTGWGTRRTLAFGATLLATMMTAAACGSSGDGSSQAGSSSASGTITVDGIAFPKPEKTTITIGISSVDVGVMPTYLITAQNIGKKFGMTIKEVELEGDGPVVQSLVAGKIDVFDASGSAAFSTQKTNVPAEIIYVGGDAPSDVLLAGKDIKSAADLKGKSIAVSSLGSYSYAEALISLQDLGLSASDVTLTSVGHDNDRLAALKSGSVAASIQDIQTRDDMVKQGYHALVSLADVKSVAGAGYIGTALTVPKSFAQKYPNTTLDLEAIETMGQAAFHNQNSAAENDQVWAQVSSEPLSQASSDVKTQLALPWSPPDGSCKPTIVSFMQKVIETTDKTVSSLDPSTICTNEYVQKLASLGLTSKLKIPTSP